MEKFVDLHTHTAHSRETNNFTENRLANYAEAKRKLPGFTLVSMLDHDTLNYLEPMYRNRAKFSSDELPFILPGIEITSAFSHPRKPGKVVQTHLLGYFPTLMAYDESAIRAVNDSMTSIMRRALLGKVQKNVDLRLGYFFRNGLIPSHFDFDTLKAKVLAKIAADAEFVERKEPKESDIINWPINTSDSTLVAVLVEAGILSSEQEGKLLADRPHPDKSTKLAKIFQQKYNVSAEDALANAILLQGSCHGSYNDAYDKLTTQEAIAAVKKADGIAILAHPMVSLKSWGGEDASTFFAFCKEHLVPAGLNGMEAFYPRQQHLTPQIIAFCEANGLFITGGSDDHQDGRDFIGDVRCPIKYLERMLDRTF